MSLERIFNFENILTRSEAYCSLCSCLHVIGAVLIIIGCLFIRTRFGMTFLAIGILMLLIGVIFALFAVIRAIKEQNRKRYVRSKKCYGSQVVFQAQKSFESKDEFQTLNFVSNFLQPSERSPNYPFKLSPILSSSAPSTESLMTEKSFPYIDSNRLDDVSPSASSHKSVTLVKELSSEPKSNLTLLYTKTYDSFKSSKPFFKTEISKQDKTDL